VCGRGCTCGGSCTSHTSIPLAAISLCDTTPDTLTCSNGLSGAYLWARFLAKSSLGDAKSSLGDAKSSLGAAKSPLGDAKSSLGAAKSSLGAAASSLGAANIFQTLFGFQQRRWRAAERRHPTGRERMVTPILQTLQDPILLTPWVCFRGGAEGFLCLMRVGRRAPVRRSDCLCTPLRVSTRPVHHACCLSQQPSRRMVRRHLSGARREVGAGGVPGARHGVYYTAAGVSRSVSAGPLCEGPLREMGKKRARTGGDTVDAQLVPGRVKAGYSQAPKPESTGAASNAAASAAGRAAAAGSTRGGSGGGSGEGGARQGGKGKQKSATALEEWDPLDAKAVVLAMDAVTDHHDAGEDAVNGGDGAALMKWLLAPMAPGEKHRGAPGGSRG
jgi:hypothetical protein